MNAPEIDEQHIREEYPHVFRPDGSVNIKAANIERERLKRKLKQANEEIWAASERIRRMVTKDLGSQGVIDSWRMLEHQAHVFHLQDTATIRTLIASYPGDPAPLLAKPFPVFMFVVDRPAEYLVPPSLKKEGAAEFLSLRTKAFLVDAREDVWKTYEHQRIKLAYHPTADEKFEDVRERVSGEYEISYYSEPETLNPESCEVFGIDHSGKGIAPDGLIVAIEQADLISGALLTRAFCAFANHVAVTAVECVDPERPPTRQQRRLKGYVEGHHYRIVIKGRLERIAVEIQRGENVRERREHEVRGHLRHHRSGRISTVRPHRRCRGKGEFIRKDYEVAAYAES